MNKQHRKNLEWLLNEGFEHLRAMEGSISWSGKEFDGDKLGIYTLLLNAPGSDNPFIGYRTHSSYHGPGLFVARHDLTAYEVGKKLFGMSFEDFDQLISYEGHAVELPSMTMVSIKDWEEETPTQILDNKQEFLRDYIRHKEQIADINWALVGLIISALVLSLGWCSAYGQDRVVITYASYHFNRDIDYNETNPGLKVEFGKNSYWGVGAFRHSFGEVTGVITKGWRRGYKHSKIGVEFGLLTDHPEANAYILPYGELYGFRLGVIPKIKNLSSGVATFEYSVRF